MWESSLLARTLLAMSSETTFDGVAAWWREQLESDKAAMRGGEPGWWDVQAKLAIIREYEAAVGAQSAEEREALGWGVQRLAFGYHCEHPDRAGWVDAWRPDL